METVLEDRGFQVSPAPCQLPPDSSLAVWTPVPRAGELTLQSKEVSVQERGMHCSLTPAAPPRPTAVLQIPYQTAITSPGFC